MMDGDFDQLVSGFRQRYTEEEAFREIVHQYLELSRFDRVQLGLTKKLHASAYAEIAETLVTRYAERVREDMARAQRLEAERELLKVAHTAHRDAEVAHVQAEKTFEACTEALEIATATAPEKAQANLAARLKRQLVWSGLVQANEDGFHFDDRALVKALEKRFLDEVLSELESEDGLPGFFGKTQRIYEGTVQHWGVMNDLAELPHTDWLRSTIFSRTLGYPTPVYPHLITGKMDERARRTVDTALCLDNSKSMSWNRRFDAAKRTTLALFALMSRLNPKNQTSLAYFASDLQPITPAYLARHLKPEGQTRTDLALEWLLDTTQDSELAMAYLITDGSPFGSPGIRKTCERKAREFTARPNVFLRIFLVDGTNQAEKTIRNIGRAAGPTTKVVTIDSAGLAKGVIKDVADALSAMQAIEDF